MLYENELRRYDKWFKSKQYNKKVDYEYKGSIISNNINKQVAKIKKNIYLNNLFENIGFYNANTFENDSLEIMYDSLCDKFGFRSIIEGIRINDARYHKIRRLKNKIDTIINTNKKSFFLTLTFTNDSLNRLSDKTRRRYVHYYLKSISNNYVANIDFGKRNHREHYHAVVQTDFINSKKWLYGNLDFEEIDITNVKSSECLSKYVAKLVNHAIKETSKRCVLIYSR